MIEAIIWALIESDDLRKSPWKGSSNLLAGHCYVASEALYHLLGGKESGYTPATVKVEGVVHWFLRDENDVPLDITAAQFDCDVPYDEARGRGFLTRGPSRRAWELMKRVTRYNAA